MSTSEQTARAMDLFTTIHGEWFVIQTRTRQEKIVADELARAGKRVYAPVLRQQRTYAGRLANVEIPMFPGYLFLRGSSSDATLAGRSPRVQQVQRAHDQPRLGSELQDIQQAITAGAELQWHPALADGLAVQVKCGAYRGLRGMVPRHLCDGRLYLQVQAIAQAVALPIDPQQLETVA